MIQVERGSPFFLQELCLYNLVFTKLVIEVFTKTILHQQQRCDTEIGYENGRSVKEIILVTSKLNATCSPLAHQDLCQMTL